MTSNEVVIERGKQKDFDRTIWSGDCRKVNGVSFVSDEERICACRKRIKMNGIATNIFWTLYPDDNGFVKCSYYYRESGKYKIQNDITLFSQNDEIQKIVRLTNIFPWFKKEVAQICSLITVSFFG